jgi:hypothetical protein
MNRVMVKVTDKMSSYLSLTIACNNPNPNAVTLTLMQ